MELANGGSIKEVFAKLLVTPPKNAWNAVLTQLLCWSFRRFCVNRLLLDGGDLSGGVALWDSHFSLVTDFAPPQFKPHMDAWLAPETLANVPNLGELDAVFRRLVAELDKGVTVDDDDIQDGVATLLDEDIGILLEKWLGVSYAPYSIFPEPEEPDDSIDMTKLNAVNYLLNRQLVLTKLKHRRMTHRTTHAAVKRLPVTPIKTRRNKQNVRVHFSPETRSHDPRREGDKDDASQREQREGDEGRNHEEERKDQVEAAPANQAGNQEHPQPHVHAEPVHAPDTQSTESASIQEHNKQDEKEKA